MKSKKEEQMISAILLLAKMIKKIPTAQPTQKWLDIEGSLEKILDELKRPTCEQCQAYCQHWSRSDLYCADCAEYMP